jgi:hypothetical protein
MQEVDGKESLAELEVFYCHRRLGARGLPAAERFWNFFTFLEVEMMSMRQ